LEKLSKIWIVDRTGIPLHTRIYDYRSRRIKTMATKKRLERSYSEALKVTVVSKLFSVTVDGVGRSIALGAIASLTFLGGLYLYLTF
jgi:hypothetical protein